MGTHNYRLQITGAGNAGKLSVLTFDAFRTINTQSMSAFYKNRGSVYSRDVGCRERVMDFLKEAGGNFFNTTDKLLMGIRCFGELYNKNSAIIAENPNAEKILNKFVSKVFGINVIIKTEEIDINSPALFLGKKKHIYMNERRTKKVTMEYPRVITIYLRSHRNQNIFLVDCRISALLALLRERRLVSGILEGKIKSYEDVCRELVDISIGRVTGEDDSYDCLSLIFSGADSERSFKELMMSVKMSLSSPNNTDGSSWNNILWLSMFIFWINNHNNRKVPVITNSSGPADYAEAHLPEELKLSFVEDLGLENEAKTLCNRLEGISDSLWRLWRRYKIKKITMPKSSKQVFFAEWGEGR